MARSSVDAELGQFFKNVRPSEKHTLADLQIGQFALTHPKIDGASRAAQLYRNFRFSEKTAGCAVGVLLSAVFQKHALSYDVTRCFFAPVTRIRQRFPANKPTALVKRVMLSRDSGEALAPFVFEPALPVC